MKSSEILAPPPQGDPGTFIDVFSGCGGLSLGLMAAGWEAHFAIEQDKLAFETLEHNLVHSNERQGFQYKWPDWLHKQPAEISAFLKEYREQLVRLSGSIDLVAGGPPCQGFSLAGRRKRNDPRNGLFRHYVALVEVVRPKFVLLENVRGISVAFRRRGSAQSLAKRPIKPFSEHISEALHGSGYAVFTRLIRGTDVGVPQFRPRYVMLAIRSDLLTTRSDYDPFTDFDTRCRKFLKKKGLPVGRPVTVREAISDLETIKRKIIECDDSPGFEQIRYVGPRTTYQRLMHATLNGTTPNSLRLARHREKTRDRFAAIIATCRHGVQLSAADRQRFKLKKHCLVPLDANSPSHTLTTLPDDFLHYSEPRILTVREYARLQSFPDWYEFRGKYTTGGDRRLKECPRYTQVGNAVPPLLAEILGLVIADVSRSLCSS